MIGAGPSVWLFLGTRSWESPDHDAALTVPEALRVMDAQLACPCSWPAGHRSPGPIPGFDAADIGPAACRSLTSSTSLSEISDCVAMSNAYPPRTEETINTRDAFAARLAGLGVRETDARDRVA
jgi:hypothetical protein